MRVITSMSKAGYENYGKTCLEGLVEHWPCPITVYYEEEVPDFDHEKITYRPLFDVTGAKETLTILSTFPVFRGEVKGHKSNYRWNAFKFLRKCFAQFDAASDEEDALFWVDADTVWEKNISEEVLRDMVDDTFMAYLDRPHWHSCASFIGWNMTNPRSDEWWNAYYETIISGKFLLLEEWHDCFILDVLRTSMDIPQKNLAEGITLGNGPVNVFNNVFKGTARHLKGNLKNQPQRYQQLIDLVVEKQPATIMEIGTWNGHRAIEMIQQVPDAKYFGFDLFESATDETDEKEKNVKPHNKADDVAGLLQVNKVKAELYAGDTKKTLPIFLEKHGENCIDFAFIDGGHSVETIRSDWEHAKKAVKKGGVIVLDDWYEDLPEQQDALGKWGCNRVLIEDKVDFELLPIADPVKGGGKTKMAVVQC